MLDSILNFSNCYPTFSYKDIDMGFLPGGGISDPTGPIATLVAVSKGTTVLFQTIDDPLNRYTGTNAPKQAHASATPIPIAVTTSTAETIKNIYPSPTAATTSRNGLNHPTKAMIVYETVYALSEEIGRTIDRSETLTHEAAPPPTVAPLKTMMITLGLESDGEMEHTVISKVITPNGHDLSISSLVSSLIAAGRGDELNAELNRLRPLRAKPSIDENIPAVMARMEVKRMFGLKNEGRETRRVTKTISAAPTRPSRRRKDSRKIGQAGTKRRNHPTKRDGSASAGMKAERRFVEACGSLTMNY